MTLIRNEKNQRDNRSYGPNGRNYMVGIPIFSQKILQSVLILTMNQNIGHTIWTKSDVQTFMPFIATKAQKCVQFQHMG